MASGRRGAMPLLRLAAAPVITLLVVAALAGEGPPPSVDPSPTPTPVSRPYSDASAWNTPIGPDPAVDPRSAAFVDGILEGADVVGITSDPTQYTYPVYEADASTPRYDLPCTWFKCTILSAEDDEHPLRVDVLEGVPIPDGARPSPGSDGSMIIIDIETGAEYDLWMASREIDGTWSVGNASVYNIAWDAMPVEYGSRGAGVPYLAGLIRHEEVAAGRIDHAIAFAYLHVAAERCVWPASKTDGNSTAADAIPEGARIQLDPSLTEADFDAWGLDRTGRIIARALQEYGMILIDVSGRPKIMAEHLDTNPLATGSWDSAETRLHDQTIASIPMEAFRLLALPEGYVNQSDDAPLHGGCYR